MPGEAQQLPGAVPDPSVMTTEQLDRALAAVRDYINAQLDVLRQRLSDIDRATELLNETVNRVPTDVQREVGHLRELTDERFESIRKQFVERDIRAEREARDSKVAVDAAFAASKEAVAEQNKSNTLAIDKSQAAMVDALNTISELSKSTTDALSARVDDMKERLVKIEAVKQGGQEAVHDQRASNSAVYALVGLLITVLLAAVTIVSVIAANGGNP